MVGNGWDGWGLELMGRGDWMVWVGELIGRKWGKGVKKEGILRDEISSNWPPLQELDSSSQTIKQLFCFLINTSSGLPLALIFIA